MDVSEVLYKDYSFNLVLGKTLRLFAILLPELTNLINPNIT